MLMLNSEFYFCLPFMQSFSGPSCTLWTSSTPHRSFSRNTTPSQNPTWTPVRTKTRLTAVFTLRGKKRMTSLEPEPSSEPIFTQHGNDDDDDDADYQPRFFLPTCSLLSDGVMLGMICTCFFFLSLFFLTATTIFLSM
jgi:hypothetical protein